MSTSHPFISVVTPVYNGEKYLAECIESVVAQTFSDWEYVIVNNRSTDKTQEIAESYAAKDSRIRVHNNVEFLDLIKNWNHALRQISPQSNYCKVVHADDLLFPECLESMVALAQQYPTVGVVGAYVLKGTKVKCDGIPYPSTVTSGRDMCRARLLGGPYLFGSPTSTLIRADLIRKNDHFYNEQNYHADVEVMFDVLRESDFGFVHQVLSYTRLHEGSQTSTFTERFLSNSLHALRMLRQYGPVYLQPDEYEKQYESRLKRYYRTLARQVFRSTPKGFWRYHRQGLEQIEERFSFRMLSVSCLYIASRTLFTPVTKVFGSPAKWTRSRSDVEEK